MKSGNFAEIDAHLTGHGHLGTALSEIHQLGISAAERMRQGQVEQDYDQTEDQIRKDIGPEPVRLVNVRNAVRDAAVLRLLDDSVHVCGEKAFLRSVNHGKIDGSGRNLLVLYDGDLRDAVRLQTFHERIMREFHILPRHDRGIN